VFLVEAQAATVIALNVVHQAESDLHGGGTVG
jgi:hypothetical protein